MATSAPAATTPGNTSLLDKLAGLLGAVKRTSSFGGSGEGPDVYETFLGKGRDQLANESQAAYPDLPLGSRHHALAAKLATERYGPLLTQLGGLATEGGEVAGILANGGKLDKTWAADTANDIGANLRGSADAVGEQASQITSAATNPLVKALAALLTRGSSGSRGQSY